VSFGDGETRRTTENAQPIGTNALRRAFLHLRLCMFAARTIENEYLRNPFDVRDGADKIHRLPAMAQGRFRSLILHELLKACVDSVAARSMWRF